MQRLLVTVAALLALPLAESRLHAAPALVFDADNGHVLYAEDQDNQWHPASLTKVMTAYLVFDAVRGGKLTLDAKITCSAAAFVQPPSKIGLPVGGEISVETALQALIVKSGNDIAVMLAEAVGGTEATFVEQMNAAAKRLGMERTHFVNANGLPAAGQVTTARDMAKLSTAILKHFPEYTHYWSLPAVQIGKRRLGTHNSLLTSFEGADGLKTGFICDSGYNIVASATRDGRRIMAVVLGSPSGHARRLRAAHLLEHGFARHGWKTLFSTATIYTLPMPPDAKAIATMKSEIAAWDCGIPRAVRTVKAKSRRAKSKAAARKKGSSKRAESSAPEVQAKTSAVDTSQPRTP